MGSTAKALKLLDYFSSSRPTIGLTEFAKLAGYDKATTHRRLNDLSASGFVEQDPVSRSYRLGPAVLRLANVRECTFPTRQSAMPALQLLRETTEETVHLSKIESDTGLATVAHLLSSKRSTRVYIDEAEILPFHATASGIVCLAFANEDFRQRVLSRELPASTEKTPTDVRLLQQMIDQAQTSGFGVSEGTFEADVTGISAPVFDVSGQCAGAVAVATPSVRADHDTQSSIQAALQKAATDITAAWGGELPTQLAKVWPK